MDLNLKPLVPHKLLLTYTYCPSLCALYQHWFFLYNLLFLCTPIFLSLSKTKLWIISALSPSFSRTYPTYLLIPWSCRRISKPLIFYVVTYSVSVSVILTLNLKLSRFYCMFKSSSKALAIVVAMQIALTTET